MAEPFEQNFDKARRLFAEGYPEHALVPATEAVKLAPDRWDARLLLARIWLAQGGAARAVADVRAAIELSRGAMPPEPLREAREVLSIAALQLKDFDTAEKELRALAASGHTPSVVRLLAHVVDCGRPDDARTLATEFAPSYPPLESGLAALSAALSGAEVHAIQLGLAETALAAGMKREAQDRFRAVLAQAPEDARAIDGLQRATGATSATPGAQADIASAIRWTSTIFVALGISLVVFSIWRRELIEMGSRFPPQWWTGAGVASLAFGLGLVAISRNYDSK